MKLQRKIFELIYFINEKNISVFGKVMFWRCFERIKMCPRPVNGFSVLHQRSPNYLGCDLWSYSKWGPYLFDSIPEIHIVKLADLKAELVIAERTHVRCSSLVKSKSFSTLCLKESRISPWRAMSVARIRVMMAWWGGQTHRLQVKVMSISADPKHVGPRTQTSEN